MMKSSAVFTRQNPFPPDPPLPKTHYSPSLTQKLSKQQRKTSLSPARLAKPHSSSPPQMDSLSREDQRFLTASNHFLLCPPPSTEPQPSFSESWPSTDLGSSSANTSTSPSSERQARVEPSGKSQKSAEAQEDSLLAKYIERFRHGRPQSREERQQMATSEGERPLFWWLSSSPPHSSSTMAQALRLANSSSVIGDDCDPSLLQQSRLSPPRSPFTAPVDLSVLYHSDTSQCEPGDPEILLLQERAQRLLQKSEHSLSSISVPISSEGLGSDLSSPVSADEPVRRPVAASFMDPSTGEGNPTTLANGPFIRPSKIKFLLPRTCPEDDILFQWRLRRKMEQARQYLSDCQGPTPHVNPLSRPLDQKVIPATREPSSVHRHLAPPAPPPLPVSGPNVSNLSHGSTVPPHMHLLCDLLPCPLQPSQPPAKRRSPRKREVLSLDTTHSRPHAQADFTETSSEALPSKNESSPSHPSTETAEEEWSNTENTAGMQRKVVSQKEERRTGPACSKNKSTRYFTGGKGDRLESNTGPARHESGIIRNNVGQERVAPWLEESSRKGNKLKRGQKSKREGRAGDQAPPPSPIHSALGQVVSEVLFPTLDSPADPKNPGSSYSPRTTPPSPQSPASPASIPQPPGLIVQLLQEAEDSDGLEFEDDPLLQVLRQQREWVKQRISETDTMLSEFLED